MSPKEVWRHEVVFVAPGNASGLLPSTVGAGRARLHIDGTRDAPIAGVLSSAVSGRRFDAEWRKGRRIGRAQVELHPAASYANELALRLASPRGLVGWLLWRPSRLIGVAAALAAELRKEMEDWSARSSRPVERRALAEDREGPVPPPRAAALTPMTEDRSGMRESWIVTIRRALQASGAEA